MKLLLKRIYTCPTYNSNGVNTSGYTISHLYIDDSYVCDAIEDTDRGLDQSMSLADIINKKVKGETAIPTGTYKILMNVTSPKFSKYEYYKRVCKGKVPRLDNVPAFSGVLLHVGNTAKDSEGCILLGFNKVKGAVTDSRKAFELVYNKLSIANSIGQPITLTIIRTY